MMFSVRVIEMIRLVMLVLLTAFITHAHAQESVVNLFKNDMKLGDQYYEQEEYRSALDMYLRFSKKRSPSPLVYLKIGRCYYFLKEYSQSVRAYNKFFEEEKELPTTDKYYYAEAQTGIRNYEKAIASYKEYLAANPQNELIMKKIWRLNNIQFLYEDSLHFAVRHIPVNSELGEFSAVPYKNGIVFASNREEVGWVQKVDAAQNAPFYKLYFSENVKDSTGRGTSEYKEPLVFGRDLTSGFHAGPVAFYDSATKMVFTTTAEKKSEGKPRTLQLFFAENLGKGWKITAPFPHNSLEYSISDPTISEDGQLLFFTSDKPGGEGGKDIYKSVLVDGKWTRPINLGDVINTAGDEAFPYLHYENTLYFSSNGHPGLGGLDIFKVDIFKGTFREIQNMGYPLNSNYDDFGITLDSLKSHGYFTSNRENGGYDDDIYEFDMDIQPYPIQVNGVIKYIEQNWVDTSELKLLPNVKLILIDNLRDVVVAEAISDNNGYFTIDVPYFSKYKVRVVGGDVGEGIVSFEVPKRKKLNDKYEIVVVNDDFRSD